MEIIYRSKEDLLHDGYIKTITVCGYDVYKKQNMRVLVDDGKEDIRLDSIGKGNLRSEVATEM